MELPQPRPYGTEGRKPTHDFLSLYSHSTAQQDPRPPSQGGYLKTHDFLQPLERIGKGTRAKQEAASVEISTAEKPPPPAPPPSFAHLLPGGIGTYSISHISCFNQKVPKPEAGNVFTVAQTSSADRNDGNSNCSSYSGSGFTLWDESAMKKGETGKENMGERPGVGGKKLCFDACGYFIFMLNHPDVCMTTKKVHLACTQCAKMQIPNIRNRHIDEDKGLCTYEN